MLGGEHRALLLQPVPGVCEARERGSWYLDCSADKLSTGAVLAACVSFRLSRLSRLSRLFLLFGCLQFGCCAMVPILRPYSVDVVLELAQCSPLRLYRLKTQSASCKFAAHALQLQDTAGQGAEVEYLAGGEFGDIKPVGVASAARQVVQRDVQPHPRPTPAPVQQRLIHLHSRAAKFLMASLAAGRRVVITALKAKLSRSWMHVIFSDTVKEGNNDASPLQHCVPNL